MKPKTVNVYEKQGVLQSAIEDAERRLGSYIALETSEKSDPYAQKQIQRIKEWTEQLDEIYKREAVSDSVEGHV